MNVDLHAKLTQVLHGKLSHQGCLKVLICVVFLLHSPGTGNTELIAVS
jgi:hypothetical protein